jgi:hypothetical protein
VSWEYELELPEDWRLSGDLHPVRRRAEAKRLAERLRGELDRLETRAGVKANVRTDGDHSRLTFVFAKERVLEVLRALQPTSFVFGLNPDDLAEEIEPPQDEDATDYHVDADFHLGNDDEPGTMSIYSNTSDNRRVWEVLSALFLALADAIGAFEPERDPDEAMGWDPSAILKAPKT